LSILGVQGTAQQIANRKASQVNGIATVLYDLKVPSTQTFFVRLFYSTDGGNSFSEELKFVNGDVRANVAGGPAKKITWNSKQEVGDIEGNVLFKVTAEARAKLPIAPELQQFKFQFLDLKKEGSDLVIEFQVTPKLDLTLSLHFIYDTVSIIYDNLGGMSKSKSIHMQGALNDGPYYKFDKINLAGIPVYGKIIFPLADEASSISLLKMKFCGCGGDFELRNLAFSK
jgi:hypothetical protein